MLATEQVELLELNELDGETDLHNSRSVKKRDEPDFVPTPEEIAVACAEIRAGWSIDELLRRGIGPRRTF